MQTRPSITLGRVKLSDGEFVVIGDVAMQLDGNELVIWRPCDTPLVRHDELAEPKALAAVELAGKHCGPWHIDGLDVCFDTLAKAAQHAETMVGTAGEFARRVLVRDKWQRVAYEAKGGDA